VANDNAYSQHDVESFGTVLHVLTLGLWVGFHVHAVKHLNGLTLIEACSASFGAEGWKKGGPRIPASDKVYDYMIFNIEDIEVVIRLQFLMSWLQVEEAIIGVSKEWRSQCFLLWGWSMHLPSWWEQKFLVVMGFVVNMVWAGLRANSMMHIQMLISPDRANLNNINERVKTMFLNELWDQKWSDDVKHEEFHFDEEAKEDRQLLISRLIQIVIQRFSSKD